jgi:gluconate 2-dehydrogenase
MKITITRPIFPDILRMLREKAEVTDNQAGAAWDTTALGARLHGADALLATPIDPIDATVLAAAPRLKVVANIGVGYDNIDTVACKARGVIVTNTPGVVDDATADLAFSLMLAAARRVAEGDRFVRERRWNESTQLPFGLDVHHKALGIIGFGRIGKAIARRARGFDMTITYNNRRRLTAEEEQGLGVAYADFDTLLVNSDFVVLQVPGTQDTRHLIGGRELEKMKPTAVLVNTARGGVVDDEALAAALAGGTIAAAGLDVFEGEPAVSESLLALPNVVLAPHIGTATLETRHAMVMVAARNLLAVLAGGSPLNPVD